MTKSQLRHARKHCHRDGKPLADMVGRAGSTDSYVIIAEARTLPTDDANDPNRDLWQPLDIEQNRRGNKNTRRRAAARARRHQEQIDRLDRMIADDQEQR